MPINAHPEYIIAEGEYYKARTPEEKIEKLKKMISVAPSHKGAEALRAQLRLRLKKLLQEYDKAKKSKKGKKGIKKEDMQGVIIGFANSGKSSLLNILTNAQPAISEFKFTTKNPLIGMMKYQGVQIQLVENPPIEGEYYDKGLTNGADTIIIVITNLEEINKIENLIEKARGKKIIVFNKIDPLNFEQKRKINANLQSKKYNFVLISTITQEGIEQLKEKIFSSFDNIRIFTKEPGKEPNKNNPLILEPNSTIKDAAEKIIKGISKKIKETRLWGPSSKFPGQKVGLNHVLKDLDIIEFKTR
jgi:hypothetical protein